MTALVLVLSITCGAFVGIQGLVPADDAYITFRHVRNLAEAGRPAWNVQGAPVLGSTSPGYVLLLAAFTFAFRTPDVPSVALVVNSVLNAVIVMLAYLTARDLIGRIGAAFLIAALIGFNSVNVLIFSQGFESPLLIATLLACLYCARTSLSRLAMLLASLAPLIRPEGILVSPLVWGLVLARREFRWRLLPIYLAIPFSWLAFSSIYYGSPLPQPLRAIAHFPMTHHPFANEPVNLAARLVGLPLHAAELWNKSAGPLLTSGIVEPELALPWASLRYAAVAIGGVLAFLCAARRSAGGRIVYLLLAPMFLLLFGWLGHTKPWYFPPWVTFGLLTSLAGWTLALDWLVRVLRFRERAERLLRITVLVFLAALFAGTSRYAINTGQLDYAGQAAVVPLHPWGPLWHLWEKQRYGEYRAAAEYLNDVGRPGEAALISEVGVFGYHYRGEVLDSVGLCSPEALPFYPPPESEIRAGGKSFAKAGTLVPTAMVETLAPDFVVNSRVYIANLLQPASSFLEDYNEVARFGMVWGEPLLVFELRSPSGGP